MYIYTRSVRNVSGLPSYLRAIVFERPLWGMNVDSKASRTYQLLADICRTYSSCAACLCLQRYWLLYHDNAPAHLSNLVQQFLSKHSIALLRQSPYSPDIAHCDFWLFPKLRKPLKEQRFDDKMTVENNATSVLKAIPKSEFQDCFEKWKHRWNRVIQSSGDYFEGCHPPDDEE